MEEALLPHLTFIGKVIMNDAPFSIGDVLINKYSYSTAVVEKLDYRNTWYVLLAEGDEREWLAASTVMHQGWIPIDSPASAFRV